MWLTSLRSHRTRVSTFLMNLLALPVLTNFLFDRLDPDPLAVYVGNGIVIPSQDDFAAAKADVVKKGTVSVAVPKSVFSIGSLKYASGRRITTKPPYRILDWALIYSSQKTFQNDRNEFKKDYKVNGAAVSLHHFFKALCAIIQVKHLVHCL